VSNPLAVLLEQEWAITETYMKQMQGLDTVFVSMERPVAPVHIGSVLIYDPSTAEGGFVRFKDILSFIEGRLHMADTMRQKMVKVPFGIDYPYWVQDSNFDIEYHVRHVALPKPGDWRQLCIRRKLHHELEDPAS